MSMFKKLIEKQTSVNKIDPDIAKPGYYKKPNGTVFGTIPLTEGTEIVLPRNPNKTYSLNKKYLSEWRMVIISTTKKTVIGECDYFYALTMLEKYAYDADKDVIKIRGLSLEELQLIKE